jgi:hypothetical protein
MPMWVQVILYCLMFLLAWRTSEGLPLRHHARVPVPAVALWLLVAVPSVLQFVIPGIYDLLHRDSTLIMEHGQWWRPYTSFLVQDGGVMGTVFNLGTLATLGVVAVRLWGPRPALAIFFGSIVLYSVPVFLWPIEPGGGNSGATFTLAASLAGLALVAVPSWRTALAVALVVADGVALLVLLDDLHGVTMLVGPALGILAATIQRRRHGTAAAVSASNPSSSQTLTFRRKLRPRLPERRPEPNRSA